MADQASTENLKRTPLYALNVELGGKIVPFAGYEMPVQFPTGILKEHLHTRASAGLFDVSHMGQAILHLEGKGGHDEIAAAFETLVPGELKTLKPGQIRYTLLLNDQGGIRDDLMATRPFAPEEAGTLFLVVNAGTKDADFAHIATALKGRVRVERLEDRALIALQGPKAFEVLERIVPGVATMGFMTMRKFQWERQTLFISRSGYTGEDGYEISVPGDQAERVWTTILKDARVKPIGLGARDSLRLEAGLPLHGHDIDATTSPVEGALTFALSKSRKERADFNGAARILKELADGPSRVRVGLSVKEGAPAREGAEVADMDGNVIGSVTSGGPSPTLGRNIAMGYVPPKFAELGTELKVIVRGKSAAAEVVAMPFVAQRYYRKPKA